MFRVPLLLSFLLCSSSLFPAESVDVLQATADSLSAELESLPRPLAGPAGGTLGYASEVITREEGKVMPKWVAVDLGLVRTADAIALVPGWMIGTDRSERTHGFPLQFRVEVSKRDDFGDALTLFETGEDFPDPGRHPFWISFEPLEFRYVRVVASKLSSNFLGFSEVFVFSGHRNLSLGAAVKFFDTIGNNENWRPEFLTDGYTPLGLPISEFRHQRNGFRTTEFPTNRVVSSVEIDWGREATVSAVSLVPTLVIPNLMAIGRWGQGFPAAFRLELSNDDDTQEWTTVFEYLPDEERPFPSPGNVAWDHAIDDVAAQRLRITATRHRFDPVSRAFYFSLSEVQVFDDAGKNLAEGATVRASHPATTNDEWSAGTWNRENLVDGFSGDGKLSPMRDWLIALDRRRQILSELETLDEAILIAGVRQQERRRWYLLGGSLAAIAILGFIAVRLHRSQLREANRLRERIANDLHDEVGSTLGSIALNAEVLSRKWSGDSSGARLSQMATMARDASQTMRDLVWVVDHRTDDSLNLLERLRETASDLLGEKPYRFISPDPFPKTGLGPEQKRHLLLFLKESLHNVLRHSGADQITIEFRVQNRSWHLAVEDDGAGFTFEQEDEEQLDRLRSRARKLSGELKVTTEPGEGTRIELIAPMRVG